MQTVLRTGYEFTSHYTECICCEERLVIFYDKTFRRPLVIGFLSHKQSSVQSAETLHTVQIGTEWQKAYEGQ